MNAVDNRLPPPNQSRLCWTAPRAWSHVQSESLRALPFSFLVQQHRGSEIHHRPFENKYHRKLYSTEPHRPMKQSPLAFPTHPSPFHPCQGCVAVIYHVSLPIDRPIHARHCGQSTPPSKPPPRFGLDQVGRSATESANWIHPPLGSLAWLAMLVQASL
ncbi:uncharacterized protein LY79DRAFT_553795 [Colletotrichum navitas]|uniref:Uncharacterized protein n=1 Tax=Colletotrichum navitas TaxID=681940 RepID=A0AAD8Q004_9PEZI|nr:uncharacterized protein LY79DRAFT_553795 [Colletotrichum navitas]KAK1590709.1 hypothetical protein LY79DRAFT_553795 [Colletotrichum navitas]